MIRIWSSESTVMRNPNAVWKAFENEIAVLDPAVGRLSSLNEVAARCWELADGRTFEQLLTQLLNEFDVERDKLENDVREYLGKLDERGLLAR